MTEPEPSGWELMRALRDMRDSIDKLAAGMVSQALFTASQQAQKETDDRQNARLKQVEDEIAEQGKKRAQQWFAIGSIGLTALASLAVGLVLNIVRGGP